MSNKDCYYRHFFNLPAGIVTHIPSVDEIIALIAKELNISTEQAKDHLEVFDCKIPLFAQIEVLNEGRLCDRGSVVLKNIENTVATKICEAIMEAFKVSDLYIEQKQCPYCGEKEQLVKLKPFQLNIVQYANSGINSIIELIPGYCKKCGLGFNIRERSEALYKAMDMIYAHNYSSPVRENSSEENAFSNMLNAIEKYITQKDSCMVEFGSFDGYLIKLLQERGYTNITGFDPNTTSQGNLPIIKEPFSTNYVPKHFAPNTVDVVLSHNTLEVIPTTHDIMRTSAQCLKVGGYFITQVPTPLVINSLQLYRMPIAFLETMCHEYGFEIVDISPNTKPYSFNQHILIVAKKVTQGSSNYSFNSVFSNQSERESNIAEMSTYADRKSFRAEHIADLLPKIAKAKEQGLEIVLYGSGITTGKILTALEQYGNIYDYENWSVVNSSPNNENMVYQAPNGHSFKVQYAKEYLRNKHIGLLIYCIQNKGYLQEINATLESINCSFDSSFYKDYLQD